MEDPPPHPHWLTPPKLSVTKLAALWSRVLCCHGGIPTPTGLTPTRLTPSWHENVMDGWGTRPSGWPSVLVFFENGFSRLPHARDRFMFRPFTLKRISPWVWFIHTWKWSIHTSEFDEFTLDWFLFATGPFTFHTSSFTPEFWSHSHLRCFLTWQCKKRFAANNAKLFLALSNGKTRILNFKFLKQFSWTTLVQSKRPACSEERDSVLSAGSELVNGSEKN